MSEIAISRTLRALEAGWREIQVRHPQVPDVALYIASGEGKKYGHFGAGDRWAGRDERGARALPEVMISGEGLERDPTDVFGTLLHEAVHAWNAAVGVKDWSRGGRYHNTAFRDRAIEVGLECVQEAPHGWCRTRMTQDLRMVYGDAIALIDCAMAIYMVDVTGRFGQRRKARPEGDAEGDGGGEGEGEAKRPGSRMIRAECGCGRVIRASAKVLHQAPILCATCGSVFAFA